MIDSHVSSDQIKNGLPLIRKRNAVEHPGGYSGELMIHNIRFAPAFPGRYVPPTWQRTGCPKSKIIADMHIALWNMLTLTEDVLAHAIEHTTPFKKQIEIYEIVPEQRNLKCPIRLTVNSSSELQKNLQEKIGGAKGGDED